jgi:2-polyprenyl-3-methyl-5-hydroxy-6-metoxy-1,4-benzoquinol methylase
MDDGKGAVWDLKYKERLLPLTKPDPFFLSVCERFVVPRFPNGGAGLDLAGGLGRHALWLGARKWKMSVVDVSEVALGQLRLEASQRRIQLDLFALDAAEYDFDRGRYDAIILFYHFDRSLFPRIVSALSPGGIFICKMAIRWSSETTVSGAAGNSLGRNEIVSLVPDLQVVEHQERPVRNRGVVEFVGSRPQALGC